MPDQSLFDLPMKRAINDQIRCLKLLEPRAIKVVTGCRVTEILPDSVLAAGGAVYPSSLCVWAAGIKAPDFMKEIGGLETNRINQLVVKPTLQSTRDEHIFVIGDCAACTLADGKQVPPRAQSAHQMADRALANILANSSLKP